MIDSIRKFFTGGPEAVERKQKIVQLEVKREERRDGLKERDQRVLDELLRDERRHALKVIIASLGSLSAIAAVGSGVTAAVGGIMSRSQAGQAQTPGVQPVPRVERQNSTENPPAPPAVERQASPEEELDEKIARFEEAFLRFGTEVEVLAQNIQDPRLRANVLAPFDLVKINRANPNKNHLRFLRQALEGTNLGDERLVRQSNIRFFDYDFQLKIDAFAATYSPVQRSLSLRPDFDLSSRGDLLLAHHELTHVGQDTNLRIGIGSREEFERYRRFHTVHPGERPRSRLDYEGGAYLFEMELLNVMLQGRLFAAAQSGSPMSAEEIATALSDPKNVSIYSVLVDFARVYYPDRNERALLDAVGVRYEQQGHDLYLPTTTGGITRYSPPR